MEEWVGQWWHRLVTSAASREHDEAAMTLAEMQRAIGLMFRAAGGAQAVRVAPAQAEAAGGPRGWLQRLAGSGDRACTASVEPELLALPPRIAVFEQRELNRDLYLWLAALTAHLAPDEGEGWIAANVKATHRALAQFPGLVQRHRALVQAQLAQRPAPAGASASAERWVQAALRGEPLPEGEAITSIRPADVAPVWLWAACHGAMAPAAAARTAGEPSDAGMRNPAAQDRTRRRAHRTDQPDSRGGLMMFFRAESLLSWSEYVKVHRATDDDDDGNALAAANDMPSLAVAEGGQTLAARVRFDLDLPSASADDLPLGPGEPLPEWDWRRNAMQPGHCAVQRMVSRTAQPFVPPPALRAVSRRVRRRLEVLRAAPRWERGVTQGEEFDLDAWVRQHTDTPPGQRRSEAPPVYLRRAETERSLATLLLADLSLSTDAWATPEARVIDVIRDALFVFGEALAAVGDPFEMLGFSSVRRQNVRVHQLKGFDEPWALPARARVGAVKPGYYTRMGAAIRHATGRLAQRPERQRLLLLLTDGKPNDLDVYEGRYGLEDTRHAVHEAREAGVTPFCVTIDEAAHDYLPMLFGHKGYALVRRPAELPRRLALAYAALTR